MHTETKTCQNCKSDFVIEPDDFSFYEKINVPPPTLCPDCRNIRRLVWRNERNWYKRTCAKTGKNVLSMFAPDSGITIYDEHYWKSDDWNPLDYGKEYDFSRGFFEQFKELFFVIPHPNLVQKNNVNCDYSNYTLNGKNCYFCASFDGAEDSAYLFTSNTGVKNCYDMHVTSDSEYCYELVDCKKCNRVAYAQNAEACVDSFFLYDCRNCTNCFGCVGLRNRQYSIFNEQYTKEEYKKKMDELWDGSFTAWENAMRSFKELQLEVPRKFANLLNTENVTGDDISNARNVHWSYVVRENVENVKYCYRAWKNTKDGWDTYCAWNGCELFYEAHSIIGQRIFFSAYCWGGHDIEYSYNCFDCNDIFGCIGLRNKSYCIFNKQYSKEEYETLVAQIKNNMREAKEYGEFFPVTLSPFGYNETIAQDYFPKTKSEILSGGYAWRDPEVKAYSISMHTADIPNTIGEASDAITSEVIECSHKGECHEQCATAFRITPDELQFYRLFKIPLPRLCPSCRHYGRVKLKNPIHSWTRQCMCNNESHEHVGVCSHTFVTSYAPDRPEKIFCEACYNKEIL